MTAICKLGWSEPRRRERIDCTPAVLVSIFPGNHESSTMNQMYGFEGEVKSKYNNEMIDLFTEVYNCLPLCHCLNRKVLVMHGGLFSKDNVTLDDIIKTDRFRQPPEEGTNLFYMEIYMSLYSQNKV